LQCVILPDIGSLLAASFKQCIAGKQLSGVFYSGGKIHYSRGKISEIIRLGFRLDVLINDRPPNSVVIT
jgi:hypothetical protein